MGQKINPIGMRLGINRTWDSRWFANRGEYGRLLHEDLKIREFLEKELAAASIANPRIRAASVSGKSAGITRSAIPGVYLAL